MHCAGQTQGTYTFSRFIASSQTTAGDTIVLIHRSCLHRPVLDLRVDGLFSDICHARQGHGTGA